MSGDNHRSLWAMLEGGNPFLVSLDRRAVFMCELQEAIKTKLANTFRNTDAPAIVIKNRNGASIPGNIRILDYSPLQNPSEDDYSLGILPAFPYVIEAPTTRKFAFSKLAYLSKLLYFLSFFCCFVYFVGV